MSTRHFFHSRSGEHSLVVHLRTLLVRGSRSFKKEKEKRKKKKRRRKTPDLGLKLSSPAHCLTL